MDCIVGSSKSSTASSNSTNVRYRPKFRERFVDFPEALCNKMVGASLNVLKKHMNELVDCILGNSNGFCTPCIDELNRVIKTASKAGVDVGKYEVLVMQVREEEERLKTARTRISSQFHASQVKISDASGDEEEEDDDNEYLVEFFE